MSTLEVHCQNIFRWDYSYSFLYAWICLRWFFFSLSTGRGMKITIWGTCVTQSSQKSLRVFTRRSRRDDFPMCLLFGLILLGWATCEPGFWMCSLQRLSTVVPLLEPNWLSKIDCQILMAGPRCLEMVSDFWVVVMCCPFNIGLFCRLELEEMVAVVILIEKWKVHTMTFYGVNCSDVKWRRVTSLVWAFKHLQYLCVYISIYIHRYVCIYLYIYIYILYHLYDMLVNIYI